MLPMCHGCLYRLRIRNIERKKFHMSAFGLYFLFYCLSSFCIRLIIDNNRVPILRKSKATERPIPRDAPVIKAYFIFWIISYTVVT